MQSHGTHTFFFFFFSFFKFFLFFIFAVLFFVSSLVILCKTCFPISIYIFFDWLLGHCCLPHYQRHLFSRDHPAIMWPVVRTTTKEMRGWLGRTPQRDSRKRQNAPELLRCACWVLWELFNVLILYGWPVILYYQYSYFSSLTQK